MPSQERLFHYPMFSRFYCGYVATQLGSAITFIVVPLLAVTVLHAKPFEVGLIAACARAPFMLFTLFAGVTADRRERRTIMLVTNMMRFGVLFTLSVIAWSGQLSIDHLLIGVFIVGCANVYFEVAYWSYLPSIVPLHLIASASGALAAIAGAGELIGPALGGMLIKLTSAPGTLLLNAMLFMVGSAMLMGLPKSRQVQSDTLKPSSLAQIKEGMATLFKLPALRRLTIIGAVWNVFACTATPQLVIYLSSDVGLDASTVGMILAFQGLGGLIGALYAGKINDKLGSCHTIFVGGIVYGVFSMAIGLPNIFPFQIQYFYAACLFCAGWGSSVGVVNILSMRQRVSPAAVLGRVNASFRFITWGIMPACALLGGILSQMFGSHAVIIGACMGGLIAILLSFKSGVTILERYGEQDFDISAP